MSQNEVPVTFWVQFSFGPAVVAGLGDLGNTLKRGFSLSHLSMSPPLSMCPNRGPDEEESVAEVKDASSAAIWGLIFLKVVKGKIQNLWKMTSAPLKMRG